MQKLFRGTDESQLDEVLISLASTIEEHHQNRILVASFLYELSSDFQSAIRLASDYMAQIILDRLLINSSSTSPLPFVYEFAQRLQIRSLTEETEDRQNYFLFLDIYAFVDYFLRPGQHQRAFLVLKQLKLFPYGKDQHEDNHARQIFSSNQRVRLSSTKRRSSIRVHFSLLFSSAGKVISTFVSCSAPNTFNGDATRNKFKLN